MSEKPTKRKLTEIVNRRAQYEFQFVDTLEVGMVLTGTEIKSIRAGNVNMSDAFCYFKDGELILRNLYIKEYAYGGAYFNHEPRRPRKLLAKRAELVKWGKKVKEKGFTIVPFRLYITDKGLAKMEVILATGKKSFDKRNSIKEKDNKRELDRIKKIKF